MLGAMPRLSWNSSNRVSPRDASRRMSMLHHSPTRSRLRAIGHCMLPKLLRRIGSHSADLHVASYVSRPTIIMQVIFSPAATGLALDGTGRGLSCDPDGPFGR